VDGQTHRKVYWREKAISRIHRRVAEDYSILCSYNTARVPIRDRTVIALLVQRK